MVTTHALAKQIANDFSNRAFDTENLVQIWEAAAGKPVTALWRIPMREGAVTNLQRTSCPSGSNLLLIAGLDQQAQVWQLPAPLAGNPEQIRL